jgi:hypothetical protein
MRYCTALSMAVGAVVALGCHRVATQGGPPGCPGSAPPAGADPRTGSGRSQIVQYAQDSTRLRFDAPVSPTGERRRLTVKQPNGSFTLGPAAGIAPAHCSAGNNAADLVSGRVIARIDADSAYPKLGLPAGRSYVWVDRYNARTDSANAVIIPVDSTAPITALHLWVEQHGSQYGRNFSEARWLFDPTDDVWWETCIKYGCCRVYGQE